MRLVEHQTLICVRKVLERLKAISVDVWRRHVNADLYIQIAGIQMGSLSMPRLTIRGHYKKGTRETSYHRRRFAFRSCFLEHGRYASGYWGLELGSHVKRFAFISTRLCRGRYSLRSADIWRGRLIKLVFRGGSLCVNEGLSNERRYCDLNNGW